MDPENSEEQSVQGAVQGSETRSDSSHPATEDDSMNEETESNQESELNQTAVQSVDDEESKDE